MLLQRYKEAEAAEPSFIERGLSDNFTNEVFLFVYYAGHGCASGKQYFVLNEDKIEKTFWPSESKLRKIGQRCGSSVKIFVVNDCCREDYNELKERMELKLREE